VWPRSIYQQGVHGDSTSQGEETYVDANNTSGGGAVHHKIKPRDFNISSFN